MLPSDLRWLDSNGLRGNEAAMTAKIRKVWLFVRIVWREHEGERIAWRTAWEVAGIMWDESAGAR